MTPAERGQEMGFPRHVLNRRRRTREVPELACVNGEKGENTRSAVVPSGRRGKNLQLDAWRKNWAARKGLNQVTGKAGENCQHSGEMGGSPPWTRPSAPRPNLGWEPGQPGPDCVVSGPATALPVCRKMLQNGSDPKRWFAEWAKELSVRRKDRAWHEMHTMIDIIYQAGCCDQFNMGALA